MQAELQDRIRKNVQIDGNGCWIWQLRVTPTGYGQISYTPIRGQSMITGAHRVSYIAFVGIISENLQIDHLCKVRNCVNPKHLEAVTSQENIRRSNARYKQQQARTHCPKGHEYTEDNMYKYKTRAGGICRNCKTCMLERTRLNYRMKKELVNG